MESWIKKYTIKARKESKFEVSVFRKNFCVFVNKEVLEIIILNNSYTLN